MARSSSSFGLLDNQGGMVFNTETSRGECELPVNVDELEKEKGNSERKSALGSKS